MTTSLKKLRLVKNKQLRMKFLADQIRVGLKYQLRSLRDAQGLTQRQLADLIGTKQSVISRLEHNGEHVSVPTLLSIAAALDVGVVVRFESIDTILEWYSNPSKKKMTPRKSQEVLKELEALLTGDEATDIGTVDERPTATFSVSDLLAATSNSERSGIDTVDTVQSESSSLQGEQVVEVLSNSAH